MTTKYAIWLDLETTGLNPAVDCVLEVAAQIQTFGNAPPHGQFHAILHFDFYDPEAFYFDPKVASMHELNGLLAACREATLTREEVDAALVEWVRASVPDVSDAIFLISGSSIHFDRSFVKVHFPLFDSLLHYRMLDTSAVQSALELYGHPKIERDKSSNHRAMGDVESSIQHLAKMLEAIGATKGPGA